MKPAIEEVVTLLKRVIRAEQDGVKGAPYLCREAAGYLRPLSIDDLRKAEDQVGIPLYRLRLMREQYHAPANSPLWRLK